MENSIFPVVRDKQIDFILSRLHQLQSKSEIEKYAIEQNILFFKSTRSIFSYIHWLYGIRRHIHARDLLEINELLPDLDATFHSKMAEMERKSNPGIIRPIVDYAVALATNVSQQKRFRMVSLGSGSMEVERQIVERLQRKESAKSVTIVGFDISPNTRAFARNNLGALTNIRIVQETGLTEQRLSVLEQETRESVLVVISDNDIFTLTSDFTSQAFDLAITSLLLHHLHETKRAELVKSMRTIAPRTLNYDGYQNEAVIPILSYIGWHSPVFLNAAILSTIRFLNRAQVLRLHINAKIDFYNHGHYRAIFSS